MTIEELKELLADDSNQEAFKEIAASMGYESKDAISGLKSALEKERTNARELKKTLEETKKQIEGIDFEEYAELKEKGEGKKQDLSKIGRELKSASAKIEALEKEKAEIYNNYSATKINEKLNASLDAGGVDPIHKNLILNAFAGKAKFSDGEVYLPKDGLEIPAEEFFSEWVKNEGQSYLKKQVNAGAGAQGFSAAGKTEFTRDDLKTPEGRKAYMEASKKGNAQIKT